MGGKFQTRAKIPAGSTLRRVTHSLALLNFIIFFWVAGAIAAEPFLRRDATVILLAGLPGDLESESTYNDQLQSWLELLVSRPPKSIIALADNPQVIRLPASANPTIPLSLFPASRSNFLFLGSVLTNRSEPLAVIIWGHGGKQGNTAVFHVRGQRITAADCSGLADKIGAPDSRWILCFRGSGSFANHLADGKRQILSSESDTMFSSDPIEMSLLLKALRDNPALSFEALARNAAAFIVVWYKERNLARTEEPTLWLPSQKPQLLSRSSDENSLASVASSIDNASETSTNEPSKDFVPSPATSDISNANLPPVWKTLRQVAPQDFPDADAIILRRNLSYTLAANPALAAEHDEFVQILTVEGKRFGDFDISYVPPFEDITFSDCEVLSPQGKLLRLNSDAIREAHDASVGDYQAARRKFFSLPGVIPGAILHVHYRNEWKKFPLPHVSLEIPVTDELTILESTLHVTVPKDEPFHFALEKLSRSLDAQTLPINPDPIVKQTSYGATYTWQFTNLQSQTREILTSPGQGASLFVSTFPNWSDFADWYARLSKLTDEITPEIQAKAAELTRASKTDRDKILAIYNYVTGLRYVAIPLGVNSFRPHAAANVFKNQFGDCKDKANLLNTMLHSLNITAHLVLVPRFRQAYDALPGLAFNHAISRVTLPDETLWMDTTDDVCRFGLLPPGDAGRKVLVIAEQTNSLTQLPAPEPRRHSLTIRGQIDCSHRADTLPVTFDVTALGYPDYELREAAREAKEHAASVPLLSARYRLSAASFALDKQTATPVAALDQNFFWRAEGTCVGLCQGIGTSNLETNNRSIPKSIRAPFWLPKEWELALHRRNTSLFLNQGYPLILDEQLDFTLPAKSKVIALPTRNENSQASLQWSIQWEKLGETKIRAIFHAELATGELSPSETVSLQQRLPSLFAALNAPTAFELPFP